MRNRKDDLQRQYRQAVDEASQRYRAGVDSLNDGYRTTRDRYQDRTSDLRRADRRRAESRDSGGSAFGVLAIAAVAGAAAIAAAPHIRRLLDEQSGEGDGAKDVSATATINCSAQDLYDRWRSFEDFDQFMPDVIRVETRGDGQTSDWTVRGPGGQELEFTSRITEDEPGRAIAWATDDQPASHSGRVTFEEMGDQTEVRLELQLHPPAGALGAVVARLLGKTTGTDPKQQADRALRQFKRMMEREGGKGSGSSWGTQGSQSDPISMSGGNGLSGSAANTQPI